MDPLGLQTEGAKLTPEQKALYGAGAPEAFGSSEMNLFRYGGDDPVDRSDPLGLTWADLMRWQRGSDGTVSEQRSREGLNQKLIAALDHLAEKLKDNRNEGAGAINPKGAAIDGPDGKSGLHSDPGLKPDSLASYHIHRLGVPGARRGSEYQFSENVIGFSDSNILRDYPNIPHYVGVLDGPPGKFTIFGYVSKDQPYVIIRPNYGVTPDFPAR
jgi:hypothetical protein